MQKPPICGWDSLVKYKVLTGFTQHTDKFLFEAQGASPQCVTDWSVIAVGQLGNWQIPSHPS